ncbi:hypothetical protein GCM10010519_77760 [Streptomyces lactacystinicus]
MGGREKGGAVGFEVGFGLGFEVGFGPGLGGWQGWCQCGGLGPWCPGPPAPGVTPTPTWTSTSTPTVTCPPGRTDSDTSVSSHTQTSTAGPRGGRPDCPAPEAVAPPTSAQTATTQAAAPISRTRRPGAAPPPPPGGIRRICRRWGMGSTHLSGRPGRTERLGPTDLRGMGGTVRTGRKIRYGRIPDGHSIGYDQK